MSAILDREIKAYFQSPLGYVFVGVMFLFTGYFFFAYNLYGNTTDMRGIFSTLFTVVLVLIPILTMRLMSEDKKLKTDQLLLTAPVSRTALALGKYLAAVCVYLLSIMSTMVVAVVISRLAQPEWPVIFGHFIGLFLLGITLIAICLFLSSLTESQVIAAIGGFSVSFFLMLIDTLAPVISIKAISRILESLSFQNRYTSFTLGILNAADVVFFLSIAAMFVCFTIGVLEKRRWS
jgi:ABC-2 type transport system permease protein